MRITIIGSGNVATHMGAALKNAGHFISQVYSRDIQNASLLAYHLKAEAIDDLTQIDPNTDIFIIAVKDDAITSVTKQLAGHQKLILHTSGATDINNLLTYNRQAGVIYPLQTFSKVKEVNFADVPLCIEGATPEILLTVKQLAQTISNAIYEVDSAQRRVLHLAAVFACNFPNYLYSIAQTLLSQHQLDFNMIRPLIAETADKAMAQLPQNVQTGPAVRNDLTTIEKHLKMLQREPFLQQVYRLLSQGIIKMDKGSNADN